MTDVLVLPSAGIGGVVNMGQTVETALGYLSATGLFYRKGTVIVRMVQDERGGHRLAVVSPQVLHTVLFEEMTVMQWAGRGQNVQLVDASEIKESTLKTILGGHQVEQLIPNIAVIVRVPYLVLVGGQLVQLKPGYNPERGGILVTGLNEPLVVPLDVAVPALLALFDDFLFASPSDKSRAIGAVLCAALRLAGIYERHPLLVFEADDSQAGKTLMWAMICAIFGQSYGVVTQKVGGVGSLDEQLMERLVDGFVAILIDNMRGRLNSCFLEACLTPEAGTLSARIAGVRGIQVDPRPVLFGLTSNGVEMTVDAANRAKMVRIRKQRADYQFRQWFDTQGNPVGVREHITDCQPFYHGCVNAVITAWWEAGANREKCTDHSFKECIGAVDFMVRNFFKLPPLLDGHKIALERTTKPGMSWLRQIALKAATQWHVVDWTASRIAERCTQDGIAVPGVTAETDTEAASKQVGIAMASAFGSTDQIVIDDVIVTRVVEKDDEARPRKVYTFKPSPT